MIAAPRDFLGEWLVVRRRAADSHRHVCVLQLQSISGMCGRGHVGEAGAMERRHQKIARAADTITSEHAAGAVGTMRRGRESYDQEARVGIAEARNRAAP